MESRADNSDLCTGPNGESLPPWKKELIRKKRQVYLPTQAPEEREAETSTGDQNKSDRGRTRSRAAPSRAAGLVATLQAVYEPRITFKSPTHSSVSTSRMATPGAEPASNPHPAGVSHSTWNQAPAEGFSASRSVSANGRAHIRSTTLGGVQTQSHVTSSSAKTFSSSSVPLKSTISSSSSSSSVARDKMVEEKRPPRNSDVVVAPPWKLSAKNVSVHYKENNEDEELQYGPGIVNKLKSRYLSRTLREKSHSERPSLRRATSLEDWLDKEDPPEETSDFIRKKTSPASARPTFLNTSNQASRNYQLKKTGSTENCGLGNKRSVSVSDLYIAPSLSSAMRGRSNQRGTPTPGSSSPSPVKPSVPPVKEEIVIIEKSQPAETVKKAAAPVSVAPLKTRRVLPTTTLYGVEDGELPPPDTVRQVKSIFETATRKTGSSRRSQSAGPSTNRIPLSLARPTNDDSRTPAKATPTKSSAPISPKPSPLGPKPTVLPPKPVLAKTRPTQPPPPVPQSPVAPPPTTPRSAAPAPPVVATPPAPIHSPVASSTPRTIAAAPASSPAIAATPPAALPRPAFSNPTPRPAAPTPPLTATLPAPVSVPAPATTPVTTPKQNPSIAAHPPPSQSSNIVAPPASKDDQSDSSGESDDESGPGNGKGTKTISRSALENIRKEGVSQVFTFGEKGGSPVTQQQPQQQPAKQVGIIRPLTIDSVKPESVDKKKVVQDIAPVPDLIKPPPVTVESGPATKVGTATKAQPKNNEVLSSSTAPKTPNETNNPNVKINGVSNNNKAKKRQQEQSSTTVFNFTERKQVPDHIHNDGVKRPISRYKRDDSGIVILVRPGGTSESSSDYIEDAEDEVDLRRPPSPCNVYFEGWNVVINGRSSLQRQPKPKKLHISFNDEMTMLFEYPSEISLLLDDSDDTPKPLLATTPSSTGNLASYTPSKVVVGESFELGVSRIVSSTPKAAPEPSPAPVEEYLKPADVETTWSAETSADLLF